MLVRKILSMIRRGRIMLNDNTNHTGALENLTIVVFAPGSDFDRAIAFGAEGCELFAFNASRSAVVESAEMVLVNLTLLAQAHSCNLSNLSLNYG